MSYIGNDLATDQVFLPDGVGAVSRTIPSKLKDSVSVKDFGAVGDGDFSGNGTDNTTAFQNAVNTGKAVYVPQGIYKITGTIQLLNGYKTLIGDETLPVLVKTTTGPAISIGATGANLNEYSRVENLYLRNTNTPTFPTNPSASDAGVVISGAGASVAAAVQNAKVYNVRVGNWSIGFFITDTVGVRVEGCFVQLLNDYSALGGLTASNKFVGIALEAVPFTPGGISPLASIELVDNDVTGAGTPTSITSVGYYVVGSDIRDIFFDRCETSQTTYGYWIVATGNDFNWDVHIRRPIVDAFTGNGIYITGADGPGAISIDGGYFVGLGAGAGAAIYGVSSSGIIVTGACQILGIANDGSTDDGVRLDACYSCSVVGNGFQNCNYGVSLNNSKNCTITGNHFFASATDTEANPTLFDAIRIFGGSEENVISSNAITGKDATDKYSNGVVVSGSCPRNVVMGNSVDETTVTTAYSISDLTTTLVSSDASIISSNTVALKSNNAALVLQGNSGSLPVQFKDGAGSAVSYVRIDGGYQSVSRLNLLGNDASYPIVFRDGAGNAIAKINNSGVYSTGAP